MFYKPGLFPLLWWPKGLIYFPSEDMILFVPLYGWTVVHLYRIIYSFVDGHLDCVLSLATVNYTAVNMGMHVWLQSAVFHSFSSTLRGRAG